MIAGCGYYIGSSRPRGFARRSETELADELIEELTVGIDGTDIRAGVIGELGVGESPMLGHERTMLRAAARAQRRIGAAIVVHPAPGVDSTLELVRVLDAPVRAWTRSWSRISTSASGRTCACSAGSGGRGSVSGSIPSDGSLTTRTASVSTRATQTGSAPSSRCGRRAWATGSPSPRTSASATSWPHGVVPATATMGRIVPRLRDEGLGQEEIDTMLIHTPAAVLQLPGPA